MVKLLKKLGLKLVEHAVLEVILHAIWKTALFVGLLIAAWLSSGM